MSLACPIATSAWTKWPALPCRERMCRCACRSCARTSKVAEILYVGTCNRVEIVYATADGAPAADLPRRDVPRPHRPRAAAGEAARTLRAWTGEAAVEHLLLLACGLDSAQTGEQEIAAQLRDAWEDSREAAPAGRCSTGGGRGAGHGAARAPHGLGIRTPSLGDLAADRALQQLAGRAGRVGLVGVSPMTRRCATVLRCFARSAPHRQPHARDGAELAAAVAGAGDVAGGLPRPPAGRWMRWCSPPAAASRSWIQAVLGRLKAAARSAAADRLRGAAERRSGRPRRAQDSRASAWMI